MEGGCLCGAVRYRVKNRPVRGSVCHCTFCQRRTGRAFCVTCGTQVTWTKDFEINETSSLPPPR